jgi:hypothetical protein
VRFIFSFFYKAKNNPVQVGVKHPEKLIRFSLKKRVMQTAIKAKFARFGSLK